MHQMNQSIALHWLKNEIKISDGSAQSKLKVFEAFGLPAGPAETIEDVCLLLDSVRPHSSWMVSKGRFSPTVPEPMYGAAVSGGITGNEGDFLAIGESGKSPALALMVAIISAAAKGHTTLPLRPARGIGTTHRQIASAPEGALYVVHDGGFKGHIDEIASKTGTVLRVTDVNRLDWLRGCEFPAIIVDHNVWLTDRQFDAYTLLLPRVRPARQTEAA